MYIRILQAMGLAKVRKVAPAPRFVAPRASVDQDTLQAVIVHRYDLMQAYGRAFSRTLREEVARLRRAGSNQWQAMTQARTLFIEAGQEKEAVSAPARAQLKQVVALELHVAFGNFIAVAAGQHVAKGGFARAVRPHDGVHFTGLHIQREALEDFLAGDAGVEVVDLQHCG